MKGIVMEIENTHAVILTRDGEFIRRLANPRWQIGDVVSCAPARRLPRAIMAAAASLVLLISLALGGLTLYFQEAAVISIDVNPSLELSLNRFDKVIEARALGADAQNLLQSISLDGLSYEDALYALLDMDAFKAYLQNNGYMLCAVQSSNADSESRILSEMQAITQIAPADVDIRSADEETLHAAQGHGVSLGKYMLMEELQSLDPQTDMEECSHESVSQLRTRIRQHQGHGAGSEEGSYEDNSNDNKEGNHHGGGRTDSAPETHAPESAPSQTPAPTATPEAQKTSIPSADEGEHGHERQRRQNRKHHE